MRLKTVWLAEEAWRDNLENRHHNAFGYAIVGFFTNEQKAYEWVEEAGMLDRSYCWAVPKEGAPARKVTMISEVVTEDLTAQVKEFLKG